MTVMEHLKAAGFDIDKALHLYGDGRAECERINIRTTHGSDSGGPLTIVKAKAYVKWTDGCERPYPDYGWSGEEDGHIVTAYLRGEQREVL